MGGSRTMEKRGHHICRVGTYEVRQKVTQATKNRFQGKIRTTPGSSEVSIYKSKKKIESNIAEIIITAIFITLIASSCGSSYHCPSYACDDDQSRPNLVFVNH